MNTRFYSYGNIVRILTQDSDATYNSADALADAVMVDVCLDDNRVLSLFDGAKQFDADFIRSYLNILRESKVGFRLLADSPEDQALRAQAVEVLKLNASEHPIIERFLPGGMPG